MSLYLKYRPQNFWSIVWQNFIKETLNKAIQTNKLVWSYLFTWPKGTWKTSTARIFAQWLNCLNYNKDLCWTCNNCKEFLEWKNIDIMELDAASNSGVENIKSIIEQTRFAPNINHKYKVYIIDEVHMLSKSAFNALLKIMEEPPSYVIFILATTELDKIPETILSRCQTYHFSNMSNEEIVNRLEFICKEEKIEYDIDWLNKIFKISEWSLRNAIKFLEQYSSWNNSIKIKDIIDNLWLVNEEIIKDLLKNLYLKQSENYNNVITIYNNVVNSWKDIKLFVKDICFYLLDKIKEEYIKKEPNKEFIKVYSDIMNDFEDALIKMKQSNDINITLLWVLWKIISK